MHYFLCSVSSKVERSTYNRLMVGSSPPRNTIVHYFLFGGEDVANTENLVSLADRTTEEQRAIASAGGKASGEARRKRKTLKEELLLMLSEGETQQSVTLALIEKAMSGDTKAFEVIRDTIGEKPVDKVMIADVEPSVIAEVEAIVNGQETGS